MIRLFPDLEALSAAAADMFVETATNAIERNGRFSVALAGGNTPRGAYELLAEAPRRDAVDWTRVHVFWGDERCVPPDDERSNALMARTALLDHVPIPKEQIHPVPCSGDSTAEAAAAAYDRLLRDHFGEQEPPRWDLVILGLGADGHTASLVPGSPLLGETTRWAAAAAFPAPGPLRVTLTPVALGNAVTVVFLVSGEEKASALRNVRESTPDPSRWPVHAITELTGKVHWYVDEAAAGELS